MDDERFIKVRVSSVSSDCCGTVISIAPNVCRIDKATREAYSKEILPASSAMELSYAIALSKASL